MAESGSAEPGSAETDPPPIPGRRRWLRWAALGTSVLVLATAGVGWSLYQKLDGNIRTDMDTAKELAHHAKERPARTDGEALNILLLGSDSRKGTKGKYGPGGSARSDTTILLHIAADRSSATAVSLPRDLMVDIPSCSRPDGGTSPAQFAQFNWAFQFGGPSCTIRTVEMLTGIRVDHHLVIDFHGFKKLVNAVGGVEVCLPHEVHDEDANLDLPAGRQTLRGEDALGYVRSRKGFDGSDTQRMSRQQRFLGSLVKKVHSNGVLLNPAKLYPVLDAVTSSLTADEGMDSLHELYELARGLRDIPKEKIRFLTVPRRPYTPNPNRDELVQPAADRLFGILREDGRLRVGDYETTDGPPGSATPSTPTYRGSTAAHETCTSGGTEDHGE